MTEFNKLVQDTFESNFGYLRIRGEISELKPAVKGQLYITIKDENSILSAVVWASKIEFLSMSDVIENCLEKVTFVKNPTLEDYINTDKETRILAAKLL